MILNTPVITGTLAFTVAPQRRQGSTTTAPTATTTTTAITSSTSSSSLHMVDGTASRREKQLTGQWEELQGNYILRPPMEQGAPRALLHFLGGAIVGAVPHVSYRYVLERLAEKGFLIVATPYNLSFDHLDTCDVIIQRFETIAPMLARQYGAVPVVGVGHSCGALLHLLITSLFPDTPRAANALISFNNKPVTEAVPFFDEVSFRTQNQTNVRSCSMLLTPMVAVPSKMIHTTVVVLRPCIHSACNQKWNLS